MKRRQPVDRRSGRRSIGPTVPAFRPRIQCSVESCHERNRANLYASIDAQGMGAGRRGGIGVSVRGTGRMVVRFQRHSSIGGDGFGIRYDVRHGCFGCEGWPRRRGCHCATGRS